MSSRSSMYRRLMNMAGVTALACGGLGAVLVTGGNAFANTNPLTSQTFSVGSATSVSAVTLSSTSSTEGSSSAQYTVSFKATSAGTDTSTVTIASTASTFSSAGIVSAVDDTSGQAASGQAPTDTSGSVTFTPGFAWNAGDQITVVVSDVTNPDASSTSVSVNTSTDSNPATSNSLALTTGYSPADAANPATPSATGVTWTFEGLAQASVSTGGTLTLSDSSTTSSGEGLFTTGGTYTVVDNTSGKTFVIPSSDIGTPANDATSSSPYLSDITLTDRKSVV